MKSILSKVFTNAYAGMVTYREKLLKDLDSPTVTEEMRGDFLRVLGNQGLTPAIEEFLACVIESGTKVVVDGDHHTNFVTIMTGKAYEGIYDRIKKREDSPIMCARLEVVKNDVNFDTQEHFDLDKFLNGDQAIAIHDMARCFECGQYVVNHISVVDDTLVITSVTESPECYKDVDYTFDIKFNTGEKVYFGDWVGGPDSPCSISLNNAKGMRDNTMFYAEHDVGYIFTGNSCPSLWIDKGRTKILVGTPRDWRDDDWEIIPEKVEGYEKLGSICTDLWACCFSTERVISKFDNQQIDRGEPLLALGKDTTFRVTVHPRGFSGDGVAEFATIELI